MGIIMYDKLFKLLRLRDIKINDLVKNKIITSPTASKLKRNKNVYTDVLIRLCDYLNCDIADILMYKPEPSDIISDVAEPEERLIFTEEADVSQSEEQMPDPAVKEVKHKTDDDPYITSVSGIYYRKSRLESDKINFPHKFIANKDYPNICSETGYAYRANALCVIERPDNPDE